MLLLLVVAHPRFRVVAHPRFGRERNRFYLLGGQTPPELRILLSKLGFTHRKIIMQRVQMKKNLMETNLW